MKLHQTISVIGLGYVGLPVAVAFAKKGRDVIAFDINEARLAELREGIDRTNEIVSEDLSNSCLRLTSNREDLRSAGFHIVTVPTPIDSDNKPDLNPIYSASRTIGAILKPGDTVVYESTVYPGVTEEECVPILEAESGLTLNKDFSVGYSPERINPGDREHRFETIRKVVAGSNPEALEVITHVYQSVVSAGIHQASDIKTAEAAKIIENTQRDLNIALMNELALICHKIGIDTRDVLDAAGTKWNFLPFVPGLVGGHCIGVDPYYLTHRAEQIGYNPEVILAGRRINDGMGKYVADKIMENAATGGSVDVAVMGVTFKEDVPDVRNSKIADVIKHLMAQGAKVQVSDPIANSDLVQHEMGVGLVEFDDLEKVNCVFLGVGHRSYVDGGWPKITKLLKNGKGFVCDIKGVLDRTSIPDGIRLWRL